MMMRLYALELIAAAVLTAGVTAPASAADDATVERTKAMLHRTQEALRQAQSDNADLLRSKNEAEQKLATANQQIDAAKSGTKAAQASLNAKLSSAESTRADMAHKLSDAADSLTAANTKLAESNKQLAAREAELTQARQAIDAGKSATAMCEEKNVALYGYAEKVLEKYKNKGVWAAISQKEPVLGLKQVDVDNVVQEYQLKFDSQKVKP